MPKKTGQRERKKWICTLVYAKHAKISKMSFALRKTQENGMLLVSLTLENVTFMQCQHNLPFSCQAKKKKHSAIQQISPESKVREKKNTNVQRASEGEGERNYLNCSEPMEHSAAKQSYVKVFGLVRMSTIRLAFFIDFSSSLYLHKLFQMAHFHESFFPSPLSLGSVHFFLCLCALDWERGSG